MNDTLSTAAVLISCLVLYFLKVNIDGYIGVLISLFIIINGLKLVKDTMSFLIGKAPSKGFIDKVTSEILSYEGVLGIHDLDIHSYGPSKTFITVHVEVDYRVNIVESHDIIDNIEYDFMEKYNINLVIHMDPIDMVNEDTLQLRDLVRRILEDIDPKLDFHDFRVVKGTTHTKIVFDVVVPIKHTLGVEEIKSEIVKIIKEYDQTIYPVINFDFSYLEE
jgi:divalent metal cation (Fe/Co/Zn/Cd) transporter